MEQETAVAEESRPEESEATSPSTSSSESDGPERPEADLREEEATCRCGNEFTRTVLYVGGRRAPGMQPRCEECLAKEAAEDEEFQTPDRARPPIPRLLEAIGVNARKHGRCSLDNFDPAENSKALVAAGHFVEDVAEAGSYDPVRGLYLCGQDTGVGKTHLAVAVLRELLDAHELPSDRMVFDRADRLITIVQDTYGTGKTEAVLRRREKALVWVLDDLGAEKATPDVLRILTDLMSAREGHPTVVTSNYTPPELGDRFKGSEGWARLSSRLARSNFRAVELTGRDRRFAA